MIARYRGAEPIEPVGEVPAVRAPVHEAVLLGLELAPWAAQRDEKRATVRTHVVVFLHALSAMFTEELPHRNESAVSVASV